MFDPFKHQSDHRVLVAGAGPFVTLRRFVAHGRVIVWNARQSRKGLLRAARAFEHAEVPLWQTAFYNWLVGALFAVGALLFLIGSVFSLFSTVPFGINHIQLGLIFFAGSIPFTVAAYLQHFQSANAPEFSVEAPQVRPDRIRLIGWQPRSAGWISTLAQFIGTLAFNLNTYFGIRPPAGWYRQDMMIWTPDMIGSALFLLSGYLAFIETVHAFWRWQPRDQAWQIAFINLLGCVFFMTAAFLAFVPSFAEPTWQPIAANLHVGLGALCFMIGGLLLARESRLAAHAKRQA